MKLNIVENDNGMFALVFVEDDGTETNIGFSFATEEAAQRQAAKYGVNDASKAMLAERVVRSKNKVAAQKKLAADVASKAALNAAIREIQTQAKDDPAGTLEKIKNKDITIFAQKVSAAAEAKPPA